jgi:hypothetical protein
MSSPVMGDDGFFLVSQHGNGRSLSGPAWGGALACGVRFNREEMNMAQFYITNESTEDTLESTEKLQDAIRVAREVARQGPVGDPVSILESGGKAVRQFVLLRDGTVAEQAIAQPVKP